MPVVVVAELSGNHNGRKQDAIDLIHAAKTAGADAVKLQTFTPERLAVDSPQYTTLVDGLWAGRTLLDLYRETHLPWEWHAELFEVARGLGIECFSAPFHVEAVDFLESLDCPRYKVASFEVGDLPLLQRIAATGKPVVMSTGVSDVHEIDLALTILGRGKVTLLHCVSEYPAAPQEMNLRRMSDLGLLAAPHVGLSDHSLTPTAAVCAVALGASLIEKHLCLDRSLGGPDSRFSLEPDEFARTVHLIREAEACLAPHGFQEAPTSSYALLKKSLWIVKNVAKGDEITPDNVQILRPDHGLPPSHLGRVLGHRFLSDYPAGTPLSAEAYSPATGR